MRYFAFMLLVMIAAIFSQTATAQADQGGPNNIITEDCCRQMVQTKDPLVKIDPGWKTMPVYQVQLWATSTEPSVFPEKSYLEKGTDCVYRIKSMFFHTDLKSAQAEKEMWIKQGFTPFIQEFPGNKG